MAKRLTGGEAADLIILADTGLDELTKQGKVVPGRTDFARAGIGVAVRKGASKPDIASPEALGRTLCGASLFQPREDCAIRFAASAGVTIGMPRNVWSESRSSSPETIRST